MSVQLHGTGAIQSPPDDRDYQISALLAADGFAAAMPSRWVAPNLPPVLDQELYPECVAFSHSSMKAWHDHIDQGRFFNFDEHLFFQQIGGTPQGAAARWALDRMRNNGYPVVTAGEPELHKIDAYFAVPKDIDVIKQALLAYGPLTMLGPWFPSWINNLPASSILPGPWGVPNGHAVLVVGWDDAKGLLFQNSWGLFWGDQGRAWIPYVYVETVMWELWKAIDQQVRVGPLPDTSTGDPDVAINARIRTPADVGRLFAVKKGVQLRTGPGPNYPKHFLTTGPIRYVLTGFAVDADGDDTGWVEATNTKSRIGRFYVPPVH